MKADVIILINKAWEIIFLFVDQPQKHYEINTTKSSYLFSNLSSFWHTVFLSSSFSCMENIAFLDRNLCDKHCSYKSICLHSHETIQNYWYFKVCLLKARVAQRTGRGTRWNHVTGDYISQNAVPWREACLGPSATGHCALGPVPAWSARGGRRAPPQRLCDA